MGKNNKLKKEKWVNIVNFMLYFICLLVSGYYLLIATRKKINTGTICLLIFDLMYVFPLPIELILGTKALKYKGFMLALNDSTTTLIFSLFVFVVEIVLGRYIKKTQNRGKDKTLSIQKFKEFRHSISSNHIVVIVGIILTFVPIFILMTRDNPTIYFREIGFFIIRLSSMSNKFILDNQVLQNSILIGIIGLIFIKLYDEKNSILCELYRIVMIVLYTILNGKRTLFVFMLFVMFAIDLFMSSKRMGKIVIKGIAIAMIAGIYFFYYGAVTGKTSGSTSVYALISEYFFRGNSVRVAIYSWLHPSEIHILDYPFQSFLYDLFFFIPRSIWETKPYAYPDYYSSGVNGFASLTNIGWDFLTGYYAEFMSNMGFLGLFISPLLFRKGCELVDASKLIITAILGIFFFAIIQVFEYSDMMKIIFLTFCILTICEKFFSKVKIVIRE